MHRPLARQFVTLVTTGLLACGCGKKATEVDAGAVTVAPTTAAATTEPPDTSEPAMAAPDTAVATTTEADTATAEPQATAPTEADAGAAPTAGEADAGAAPAVAAGVISAERWGQLEAKNVTAAARVSPLHSAAACLAVAKDPKRTEEALSECDAALQVRVVGVAPDGRVAVLTAPAIESCGEMSRLTGAVGKYPTFALVNEKPFPDPEADQDAYRRAVWTWIASLPGKGFAANDQLVGLVSSVAEEVAGIRGHAPAVRLGGPLDGWSLDAVDGGAGASVRLVAADNKTSFVLGELPFIDKHCPKDPSDDEMPCVNGTFPNIVDVAISYDRRTIIAATAMGDGSHCGADPVSYVAWPMPAGTIPPAPEP